MLRSDAGCQQITQETRDPPRSREPPTPTPIIEICRISPNSRWGGLGADCLVGGRECVSIWGIGTIGRIHVGRPLFPFPFSLCPFAPLPLFPWPFAVLSGQTTRRSCYLDAIAQLPQIVAFVNWELW